MLDKPERDRIHVVFHDGAGSYDLNLPDCLDLPITRFKKLFTVILKEHYLNRDFESVIAPTVESWLAYLIEREKARWETASHTFQQEYRDVSYVPGQFAKAQVKKRNNKLTREVKAAKKAYEDYQKRLSAWSDIKAKYVY